MNWGHDPVMQRGVCRVIVSSASPGTLELLLDARAGVTRIGGELPLDGLTTRPELHQASGMISVQLGVGLAEAMARLRARAFADERPLHELAGDVVARRLRFEIEDAV